MRYSLIIPVYNRPDEVRELLESLTHQTYSHPYEVILVEDGSSLRSADVVDEYRNMLPEVQYIDVPNGGPSKARNLGASSASGEYLIILDSDVVLPPGYLTAVDQALASGGVDAFGGPDAASDDFSDVQKAINYAMTSPLTTGGIRGGKAQGMEKFKPRSFNLGCRRELYLQLHGFNESMRFGEDIDFSLRLIEEGAHVILVPEAYVYHKRRVDFRKFYKQVHNSGIARIHLETRHPGSTRIVHLLPAAFVIGTIIALCLRIGRWALIALIALWLLDAHFRAKLSWRVSFLAVLACFVQLWGYGLGFLRAWWGKYVMRSKEFTAFRDNFYD